MNVLIRLQHEFPPLPYEYSTLHAILQMKMDFDTKCYKVFVVGYNKGRLTIEIYDSGTRQWTKATPPCGFIFGRAHNWIRIKS